MTGAAFGRPPAPAAAQRCGELSRTQHHGAGRRVGEVRRPRDTAHARRCSHTIRCTPGRVPGSCRIARGGDAECAFLGIKRVFYCSYIVCTTRCNKGFEYASSVVRSLSPPPPNSFPLPAAGPCPAPPTLRTHPSQAPMVALMSHGPHQRHSKAGAPLRRCQGRAPDPDFVKYGKRPKIVDEKGALEAETASESKGTRPSTLLGRLGE